MATDTIVMIPDVLNLHDVGGASVNAQAGMIGIVNVNGTLKQVAPDGTQTSIGGSSGSVVGTVLPLAVAAAQMQVTGLTPATQLRYEITGKVLFPAGVASTVTLDLNGIAAATFKPNTTTRSTAGAADTSVNIAATQNLLDGTGAGHTAVEMYFRIVVQAKSGEGARYFEWQTFRQAGTNVMELPAECRGYITDTSTEISVITLACGAGGAGIGSWMRVRALN